MGTSVERVSEASAMYRKSGYSTLENAIDDTLVTESREHIDWLLEHNPETRPEQLGFNIVGIDPFWLRLVSDDRLLDVVEAFIGPDIALFATHYIAKPPGDGQPVLWHQDGVYWPLEPKEDVITMWLALDQTRPTNGCMQVLPGTQTLELQEITESTDVDNVLGSEIDMDVNTDDAVMVELEPGDVSIHHPNILHGSEANTSYTWRRGLTIRYIPTSTTVHDGLEELPILLRGDLGSGDNEYQPWPLASETEHMAFAGEERYDERAEKMNDRVADAAKLRT